MKIELNEILVRDIVEGYIDNHEEGVVGYGGRLNIRPPYQREFIYKDKQRDAVIDTVQKGFPLNVMYWVKNGDNFEVLDGQQRTISLCQYVQGDFSVKYQGVPKYFDGLPEDVQNNILDCKLMIYFCEGTDSEKLDWFRIINIVGIKFSDQELRNVVYTGTWLADAKLKFSKNNCAAYLLGRDYVTGVPIRQDYLETALDWIKNDGEQIEDYMARYQSVPDANELWSFFQAVIEWVQTTFPTQRRDLMRTVHWGRLYKEFKDQSFDTAELENRIKKLLLDDDVTRKQGIYEYVLTGDERCLNVRPFSDAMKYGAYERQNGICPKCEKQFEFEQMEGDHITPWCEGGKTITENCQMLCKDCNRRKSGK